MECDARSSNGTPLFRSPCKMCGCERLVDRRRIGGACPSCASSLKKKHGQIKTHLYRQWAGMKARCLMPSASNYQYYGGRGIRVCGEWMDYMVFAEWANANGYRQSLEIDRIENDGDYEPGNCRFVTHQINSQKRSNGKCDVETAAKIKKLLSEGVSVKKISADLSIQYMIVWHISKGNTWRNA